MGKGNDRKRFNGKSGESKIIDFTTDVETVHRVTTQYAIKAEAAKIKLKPGFSFLEQAKLKKYINSSARPSVPKLDRNILLRRLQSPGEYYKMYDQLNSEIKKILQWENDNVASRAKYHNKEYEALIEKDKELANELYSKLSKDVADATGFENHLGNHKLNYLIQFIKKTLYQVTVHQESELRAAFEGAIMGIHEKPKTFYVRLSLLRTKLEIVGRTISNEHFIRTFIRSVPATHSYGYYCKELTRRMQELQDRGFDFETAFDANIVDDEADSASVVSSVTMDTQFGEIVDHKPFTQADADQILEEFEEIYQLASRYAANQQQQGLEAPPPPPPATPNVDALLTSVNYGTESDTDSVKRRLERDDDDVSTVDARTSTVDVKKMRDAIEANVTAKKDTEILNALKQLQLQNQAQNKAMEDMRRQFENKIGRLEFDRMRLSNEEKSISELINNHEIELYKKELNPKVILDKLQELYIAQAASGELKNFEAQKAAIKHKANFGSVSDKPKGPRRNAGSKPRAAGDKRDTSDITCFACKKPGHYARDCPSSKSLWLQKRS